MNRIMSIAMLGAALLLPARGTALGHTLIVTPAQAVVLPSQGEETKVAMSFDLSGLKTGEGRVILEAVLDWRPEGIPSDRHSEYAIHAATGAWTEASVGAGGSVPMAEEASADWEVEPLDVERNGGGLLRFDLTELARNWAENGGSNQGIVLVTPDVPGQALAGQLSNATLTVRYVFR